MKDRLKRWLHQHGHHQLCRVVVEKVVVGHDINFEPEYLVGYDEQGVEHRVDATVFGGSRKPKYDWRVYHR